MKYSTSCFLLLLFIFLFSEITYARKDMGDYWKSVMNDQPMPEALKDLFSHQDEDVPSFSASKNKDHRFVRDFDIRPNVIIYHSAHHHHADHQPEEMMHEMQPKAYIQTVNHG
ncbi:PREDICTED: organ-specific protein P4 [Fragaria vesca subsp. vesca]|uniref:organ-specific protein P4 n=1 Tax=Fragaria vesca subsp. vesca TaxID=101020 RepID=UPI0002C375CD|nr:PREDICTED: organ-specific protein P4 [Fragaria vesca subsp. vesca]